MLLTIFSLLIALINPQEIVDKAGAFFDEGNFREAASVIDDALPELREAGDEESLAECLSMLSVSYSRLGMFDKALDAQRECYDIDLKTGDIGNISSSLNNLAGICLSMNNYDEAERLIREAISYEEKLGESAALAVRYGMASEILLKQGKVDEAVSYASKALEIDKAAGRVPQAAVRQSQLAAAYMDAGRLREAAALLAEAAVVFQQTGNLHSLSVCRQQQGTIAAKSGDFRAASNFLREGLTLSRQTGNILLQRNISQDLAVVLKDIDAREAIGYMQDVQSLSDSLYREETARKIAELQLQTDLADKERQIAAQQRLIDSRRATVTMLATIIVLLIAVIGLLMRALHLRKKNDSMMRKASEIKDRLLVLGAGGVPNGKDEMTELVQELSNLGVEAPEKTLTNREREIARLCGEGLQNKEIADRLNISTRTVETHKNNIFRKLGINTTAELVQLMDKLGRNQ